MESRFGKRFSSALRNKKGFTLIEMALVLGVIAVLGGVVMYVYSNRVAPTSWASANVDRFGSVMAALNTAKADKGGTYPAAASAGSITNSATTTTAGAVSQYVGSASTDISSWTYQCVSGTGPMKIAIVDSATPSADAQGVLVNKINSQYFGGTTAAAVTNGTTITVTVPGAACA